MKLNRTLLSIGTGLAMFGAAIGTWLHHIGKLNHETPEKIKHKIEQKFDLSFTPLETHKILPAKFAFGLYRPKLLDDVFMRNRDHYLFEDILSRLEVDAQGKYIINFVIDVPPGTDRDLIHSRALEGFKPWSKFFTFAEIVPGDRKAVNLVISMPRHAIFKSGIYSQTFAASNSMAKFGIFFNPDHKELLFSDNYMIENLITSSIGSFLGVNAVDKLISQYPVGKELTKNETVPDNLITRLHLDKYTVFLSRAILSQKTRLGEFDEEVLEKIHSVMQTVPKTSPLDRKWRDSVRSGEGPVSAFGID